MSASAPENEPRDEMNDLTSIPLPSIAAFTSHSAKVLRSMVPLAFAGHAAILAGTILLGYRSLAFFNIGSCVIFAAAYVFVRHNRVVAPFIMGTIEVVTHSWFATYLLGFESGFHIYALTLIPLALSFDPWSLRTRSAIAGALVVSYVSLLIVAHVFFPPGTEDYVYHIRIGNLFVGALVLFAVSYYYVAAVATAEQLLVRQNSTLESLSRTDQLTTLPNRRYIYDWIPFEAARVRRTSNVACVCVADVDDFKMINDGYGHDAGDEVLRRLAAIFRSTLRGQDVIARWGGEEFLFVLPSTDTSGGVTAMEKVRSEVCRRGISVGEAELAVSVTIGVSELGPTDTVEASISRADHAMYAGKRSGKNRVVCS